MLEAVLRQYAECVDDCIYRWEREIHNMHDMVTGEATCDDALDAEDAILRVLYNERRQMAEGVLHSTKGALQSAADMHFESHFYASIHFGLAEQLTARQDLFKVLQSLHLHKYIEALQLSEVATWKLCPMKTSVCTQPSEALSRSRKRTHIG